ncbi:MAG: complex I subunit 4 family protein [Phycisphaerae bacterium]
MNELAETWILTLLIALPLVGAVVVGLTEARQADETASPRIRRTAMGFSVATAVLSVLAILLFFGAVDRSGRSLAEQGRYALCLNRPWVSDEVTSPSSTRGAGYVDFRYHVGVDGISLWLVVLTAGITPLTLWSGFDSICRRVKEYHILMLLLEAGMIGVFCARDLLLFYIFFEFTLIPLYFIIGIWGGPKRQQAANKFFIYTFAGSVLTFAGVLFLAYQAYSLPASANGIGVFTFDLETLYALRLPPETQWWLFIAFAAGFAIKVPLFPLHTWLPLAHTEAPTAGSVLLAAILLKLGTYGFLRFSLPMLPAATFAFAPLMAILAIGGIIWGALAAWVQQDIKKLIAYSSVSHLGFCMLGMFSLDSPGLVGSVMYMLNHGLSTGALFLIVGMIYERYHTRRFDQLGGLARPMPWMTFFLVFFTLSSIGLPGLNGFVAEFLVLLGTLTSNADGAGPLGIMHAAFAASGIILGAIYMLYLCRRVLFGPLREPPGAPDNFARLSRDLNKREVGILAPIAAACLALGLFPNVILSSIRPAVDRQILARLRETPEKNPDSGIRVQRREQPGETFLRHRWALATDRRDSWPGGFDHE